MNGTIFEHMGHQIAIFVLKSNWIRNSGIFLQTVVLEIESLLAEQDHLGSAPRASLEPWWQDVNDHATAVKILTQLEHRLQGQLMPATPVARQVETTPQTNPMTEEAP